MDKKNMPDICTTCPHDTSLNQVRKTVKKVKDGRKNKISHELTVVIKI